MLKATTYISVTEEPLHCIPFQSSSPPQGSPPLDCQPDNWDGLFMLLNITLSAATEIMNQTIYRMFRTMTDMMDSQREEKRACKTLTVSLVGLGHCGRRHGKEDGQPDERRRRQGAPSSSHCAPREARRVSAEAWEQAGGDPHARVAWPLPPLSHGPVVGRSAFQN